MSRRFYNCHAHCFTYDHVPEFFLTRWIGISWLLRQPWLKKLIRKGTTAGRFDFGGTLLLGVLRLAGINKAMALRTLNFIRYGDEHAQATVIEKMRAYYPRSTGLVMLTMDMEYMGAGKTAKSFRQQVQELALLKTDPAYEKVLFPFIFVIRGGWIPVKPKKR
jgi:hypothetical protein